MPDPDRLLKTIEKAAQAFSETPGRRGRLVVLNDSEEVLVAGDLHGNLENFRALLDRADLGKHPRRHLVLQELVHGPHQYPGGGDKSHQLVDLTAALKCQYPAQVHVILGNHELAQVAGQLISKTDFELTTMFRIGVDTAYGRRAGAIYGGYMNLLARAPLAVRTANRVFISHSLPWPGRVETFSPEILEQDSADERESKYGGSIHSLLWGRDVSPEAASLFLAKVDADLLVTGHIPCPEGYLVPNDRQVILDSSAAPAAYCLFPTTRRLTHTELVECIRIL
jgi:hypothetical protein